MKKPTGISDLDFRISQLSQQLTTPGYSREELKAIADEHKKLCAQSVQLPPGYGKNKRPQKLGPEEVFLIIQDSCSGGEEMTLKELVSLTGLTMLNVTSSVHELTRQKRIRTRKEVGSGNIKIFLP